jgi:PAS domain S-box-containing protein
VKDRRSADEALRESEERFRGAFHYSPIGMGIVGLDGRFQRVNPALCRIGGYSESELLSRTFQDVVPEDELELHRAELRRLLRGEIESYQREVRYRHRQGHFVWVRFVVSAIRDRDGRIVRLLGQAEDISARKEAEDRLRRAERLEAVGTLAGGVAHEFNNLLAVIGGFARHALETADPDSLLHDLTEIVAATRRAADISRQLLAFSRDVPTRPSVLDLNDVVRGIEPMLRSLIREDVELVVATAEDRCLVCVDRGQFERVIVNLVVNARDAMRAGGRVEIATQPVLVSTDSPLSPRLKGSRYVALSVTDTGTGIDPAVRHRLFDPFFTTKEQGEGTGLGLSIVHGIVEQSGGAIAVESDPGQGATFTVYLPSVAAASGEDARSEEDEGAPVRGGVETVLVVEDEAALLKLIETILSEAGYRVLTAADGEKALEIVTKTDIHIDLVLTDSIMPKLSGAELANRLRTTRPGTRVLQMTGYSGGDVDDEVITKPFEPALLLRRVRQLLDRR